MAAKRERKTDVGSAERAAVLAVMRARQRTTLVFHPIFEKFHVTEPQYRVLQTLFHGGGDGMPQIQISQAIPTSKPNVTGLLKRLEASGLVERTVSQKDNRVKLARLTRKGRALLQRLEPAVQIAIRQILGPLTPSEQQQIVRLLDRIASQVGGNAAQSHSSRRR